ncbi:MAG: saccharopine dehydrogenase [Deltaproteobacteria bacterium]|nr:MAG: saccharopine dehydrogenase [Deltaproteobacteria bacterium]
MKQILVLGAGLVTPPLVRYLLDQTDLQVTVADQFINKAQDLVKNHPRGRALALDVNDKEKLAKVISNTDIVVSMLPWVFHPTVASICINFNKHLVTASYVKEEMRALDAEAKRRGLIFLNEVGVDPGIDHMAAMNVIDRVKKEGGEIVSYHSYCGGLPALESNNNPLGYKFSWSPEGAILAATNDGRYLEDGQVIEVPGDKLFEHYWLVDIPRAGVFEVYVNRDALPYLELYDIKNAKAIFRGTLRNVGYCETWDYFKKLGLLNRQMKFDFREVTPRQVIANIVHGEEKDLKKEVAQYLCIPEYSLTLKKLEWLGLFSDEKLPLETVSVFEMLAYVLKNKLRYNDGEMDLLIQHHEFIAEYPGGRKKKITSTLINQGIPNGDSSMSRTVGLPVAIATTLIARGKVNLTGVHIPILPEIYKPVLVELENFGIKFEERQSEIAG